MDFYVTRQTQHLPYVSQLSQLGDCPQATNVAVAEFARPLVALIPVAMSWSTGSIAREEAAATTGVPLLHLGVVTCCDSEHLKKTCSIRSHMEVS